MTTAEASLGTPNWLLKDSVIWLACIMLPVPKSVARAPQTAKAGARTEASFLFFRPFFM